MPWEKELRSNKHLMATSALLGPGLFYFLPFFFFLVSFVMEGVNYVTGGLKFAQERGKRRVNVTQRSNCEDMGS